LQTKRSENPLSNQAVADVAGELASERDHAQSCKGGQDADERFALGVHGLVDGSEQRPRRNAAHAARDGGENPSG
jgi:hypothetical protein